MEQQTFQISYAVYKVMAIVVYFPENAGAIEKQYQIWSGKRTEEICFETIF